MGRFGGSALSQSSGSAGDGGRPTPVTMNDLEGYFDSLATAAVTNKDKLKDLTAANLALTKTVADLTNTNARLLKKAESWTNNSDGGGGGRGSESSGSRPEGT